MTNDGNNDGIFWPGYVDAISNLVLNLLFVVAILTIAVFLFAIELGRKQGIQIGGVSADKAAPSPHAESPIPEERQRLEKELVAVRKELLVAKAAELRKTAELARVTKESEAAAAFRAAEEAAKTSAPETLDRPATPPTEPTDASRTPPRRVQATEVQPGPEQDIEKIAPVAGGIVIDFTPDAVSLTKDEQQKARAALAEVVASGIARLEVRVPGSFSEARRLAFYRAMSVRNLLIEMGLAAEKIDISVSEGIRSGDSTKVWVRGAK